MAKTLALALTALLLLTLCPAASALSRALLVGCDYFIDEEPTAPSSLNNVASMAEAMTGALPDLAALYTRGEGVNSAEELGELIRQCYAGAGERDVSYFYISTHGRWDQSLPDSSLELLLSDGLEEGAITAGELRALLDQVPGIKVLILDACHAGAALGKGVYKPFANVFQGGEYKVLCSSGGFEDSWYWSGGEGDERGSGEGYFSGALAAGITATGGRAADGNRDGSITLAELRSWLRLHHGASTVQCYPEEDSFPVFRYDPSEVLRSSEMDAITGVTFETGAVPAGDPVVGFSFTVRRSVRVAYQLVTMRREGWDWENATLVYDNSERNFLLGDAEGQLSPGYKQRRMRLNLGGDSYGYVLAQVLLLERGGARVAASTVLCVPPASGDPDLNVLLEDSFVPEEGGEMTFVVQHRYPCEMTVTVEDALGNTVRRLASRQPSRPEQLYPAGSTFCWNGLTTGGDMAAPGWYRVCVRAWVGGAAYEYVSRAVELRRSLPPLSPEDGTLAPGWWRWKHVLPSALEYGAL